VIDCRITPAHAKCARDAFEANEPRGLFYRAATELVGLALRGETSLTVAEALAVLLQTWNGAYYRYRKFDNAHFASIEKLLLKQQGSLAGYRNRTIDNLDHRERTAVSDLFQEFESVLGPVGAAKTLHLLAPRFFPLWDRAIAVAYDLRLGVAGSNGDRYWCFMLITQRQSLDLRRQDPDCPNPLKSIDEYNYCKYTKGWLL
jgi:hypothetical protein